MVLCLATICALKAMLGQMVSAALQTLHVR